MINTAQITKRALQSPYTAKSFATLDKHAKRGPIDTSAALRLLRRNARDASDSLTYLEQNAVARQLLQIWKDSK